MYGHSPQPDRLDPRRRARNTRRRDWASMSRMVSAQGAYELLVRIMVRAGLR